jgi:hypothetical protein
MLTVRLVVNLKNEQSRTTNELQIAQQRVAELEAQLAHTSAPVNHDHTPHTGSSTFPHPPAEVERYYSGFAQTILGIEAQPDLEPTHSSNQQPLPSLEVLRLAATAFFDAYHVQYPFLDRGEFMVDLQDIHTAEQGSGAVSTDQRKEFSVLMFASVGAYLCEQKGDMEDGIAQSLKERAMRGLAAATSKTDLVSFCMPQLGSSSYVRSQYKHTLHYYPLSYSVSIPRRQPIPFSLLLCRLPSVYSYIGNHPHHPPISNSGIESGGLSTTSIGLLQQD